MSISENGQGIRLRAERRKSASSDLVRLEKGHTRLNRHGTYCYDLYQLTAGHVVFFRGLGKKVSIVLVRDIPDRQLRPFYKRRLYFFLTGDLGCFYYPPLLNHGAIRRHLPITIRQQPGYECYWRCVCF